MEAIIHPGMHKTGTSSIQATLMALKPEGWIYPTLPMGNMGGRFALLFEKKPHEHHSFRTRGVSEVEAERQRVLHYKKFLEQLEYGADTGLNTLFSGEYLSVASRESIEKIASLYQEYGFTPRVIAYVRKPMSFMQSAFQQRIKSGLRNLNEDNVGWPDYRVRFEKFDEIFGKENVHLSVFEKSFLKDGDVCLDFYGKLGIDLSQNQVVRVNESLSLSACALLFAQRHLGDGFVKGFKDAPASNNAFIDSLAVLKGEPLTFKKSIVEATFEKNLGDLEWMESRLGVSLSDIPEDESPYSVGSEEDLLTIAESCREQLEQILIEKIYKVGDEPRDKLINNLEFLRKMHY